MKVLVSDKLSAEGVAVLQAADGIQVDVEVGLSEDALCERIGAYDGLLIRSATRVTAKVLDHAKKLRAVGRAGIGVDNIDLLEASRRDVVVMNAPFGNAVTTAEHAIALLCSWARRTATADASMKAGRWEKSKFRGVELWNKTFGILGWGNIGKIVADRAGGLRMRVIACDPTKNPEEAAAAGVTLVDFDTLLAESDFLSIHAPLRPSTRHLIGAEALSKMKSTALLINAARGGIVDEEALADALEQDQLAGAAVDVFAEEPLGESRLRNLPNVLLTPHLGASTTEAQARVGEQIAEQMVLFLREGTITHGVNTPTLDAKAKAEVARHARVADALGALVAQLAKGTEELTLDGGALEFAANADLAPLRDALAQRAAAAFLGALGVEVTAMSAPYEAKDRGLRVVAMASDPTEDAVLSTELSLRWRPAEADGSNTAGLLAAARLGMDGQCRLTRLDDHRMDVPLGGIGLVVRNENTPGVIGAVGGILGDHRINVAQMQVARSGGDGALAYWTVDDAPATEAVAAIDALPAVDSVTTVHLPGEV